MKKKIPIYHEWRMKDTQHGDRCWWWLASLFMGAMLALIATACQEEKDQLPADEVLLSLSLAMPGGVNIHSRAISSTAESALNNVAVLVFEVNDNVETFVYEAAVIKTTPMTIRIRKSVGNKKYRLVLLANARQWIPLIKAGTAKDAALHSVKFKSEGMWNVNSDADYTPIPMWGETTTAEVITESTTFQAVTLLRALARIDVGVKLTNESAAGLSNFKLTSVSVYRSKNKGYVVPVDAPADVSIPADTLNNLALTYNVTDEKSLIRAIYVAEVPAGTTRDHALCLVIGGKYNNSTTVTYYRVDITLPDGNYAPLKRNCKYVVNIKEVSTEGYTQESDALTGDKSIGISGGITVDDWGSGTGNNTSGTI